MIALPENKVTLSEQVLRLLPADIHEANLLVNEILEQALLSRDESEDQKLENRPDWQAAIELSRQQRIDGNTLAHEEVLRWHQSHP